MFHITCFGGGRHNLGIAPLGCWPCFQLGDNLGAIGNYLIDAAAALWAIHQRPLLGLAEGIFGEAAGLRVYHLLRIDVELTWIDCFGSLLFIFEAHTLWLLVCRCNVLDATLVNLLVSLLIHGQNVGRLLDNSFQLCLII